MTAYLPSIDTFPVLKSLRDLRTKAVGESPVIFFDSHPEQQDSYLYSYVSSLKSTLSTAWTGIVPPFLEPGELRIVWWTTDGNEGNKDYPLRKYREVRDQYETLLNHPDVKRCLITGYPGQNPYAMTEDTRKLVALLEESAGREAVISQEQKAAREAEAQGKLKVVRPDAKTERIDVDEIVEGSQKVDRERRLKAREKEAQVAKAVNEQLQEKTRLLDQERDDF